MSDAELEALIKKKRVELEQLLQAKQREQIQKQEELKREALLKQILTSEARERLVRVKLARPEFGRFVEDQLIAMAQAGRIRARITDSQLKEILKQFLKYFSNRGSGKVIIRRK